MTPVDVGGSCISVWLRFCKFGKSDFLVLRTRGSKKLKDKLLCDGPKF